MINNVSLSSYSIEAGDTLLIDVDASYPVIIEIYCFVTQPPPTKFIPCPSSGRHMLEYKQTFSFETRVDTFSRDGRLDLTITDADLDMKKYTVNVAGLSRPLAY